MPKSNSKTPMMKLDESFVPEAVTEARALLVQATEARVAAHDELRAAKSAHEGAPKREAILDAAALAEGRSLPVERETDRARERFDVAGRAFDAGCLLEARRTTELCDIVAADRQQWLETLASIVGDRGDDLAEQLGALSAAIDALEPVFRVAIYVHSSIGRDPDYALKMFALIDSTAHSAVAGTAVEQIAAGIEGARLLAAQVQQRSAEAEPVAA